RCAPAPSPPSGGCPCRSPPPRSWWRRRSRCSCRQRSLRAGDSALAGIAGDRLAQRARERLEGGLDHVVRVAASLDAQVQSELRRVGQCAKELLRELVLESARSARRKLRLERGERTAGHVDGAARTRLVHGHGRRAEARYARAVAERAVERLAQSYR